MTVSMKDMDESKPLRLLLAFFGESTLPRCQMVAAEDVPPPFDGLLVHDAHMTVTLEAYHQSPVTVHPYQVHQQGELYGRKLDLKDRAGRVVMTGLMIFNFRFCTERVRDLIIAEKTPLGRILIENNILRRVSTEAFLRIDANDPLTLRFHSDSNRPAFGRLATIFCNEVPAVDLLEVVHPDY